MAPLVEPPVSERTPSPPVTRPPQPGISEDWLAVCYGPAEYVSPEQQRLFGYIIWVGLLISWLFFHGVLPPLVKG
jgi:hypothetical protein